MTLGELLYEHMEVREAAKDGEVWVQCPFCGDEKFRMGINIDEGKAHCFRASCEWKTSDKSYLFRSLAQHFHVDAVIDYVERDKAKPKNHSKVKLAVYKTDLPDEFEALWTDVNEDVGERALDYVLNRGITKEQIKKHRLGFCAYGKYAWRIVFPVMFKGKTIGFTCRDFSGNAENKYLNSEGLKLLYNIPRYKKNVCILSEGPIDALAVERSSDTYDSIGKLGTGLSVPQLRILKDYDEIVIWGDPDKAGVDMLVKTAVMLDRHRKVSVVMIESEDDDPGKLGETERGLKAIRKRIEHRIKWSESVPLQLYSKL